MLEATQHADNTFVTLTYNEESYPHDHSVNPRTLQLFLKRLRKRADLPLRFFGVGEYGDNEMRPHYHLALFGYPNCTQGLTRYDRSGHRATCCPHCQLVQDSWSENNTSLGRIQLAPLETDLMQYVCGYVVKKMTKDDDERLEGRLPEFARMSLRPGIGLGLMHDLASTLMKHGLDEKLIDVPSHLQHGKKKYPLGKYLRKNLRKMVGRNEKTPQAALDQQKKALQNVRETAFINSRSFKEEVLQASLGRRIQIEAMAKRQKKRNKL